jgi:hypothetical protein
MNDIQKTDEGLHELLWNTLLNTSNSNFTMLLTIAEKFVNRYEPSHDIYDKIVRAIQNTDNESDEYLNYISFVNYNGLETYFTTGAFLDVVVNGQMCMNEGKVSLTVHEYYDSIVENLADLMVHYNKEKYLLRIRASLKKLSDYVSRTSLNKINDISNTLDQISSLQNQCKRLDTLINCSKFLLMNTCIQCIRQVSEVYFDEIEDDNIDKGLEKFEKYAFKFPTRRELEGMGLPTSLEDLILRLSPTK